MNIEEIVNDIYDPVIEDTKQQSLMRTCIRAWIRDAVGRGFDLGMKEMSLEIERFSKRRIEK